MTHPAAPADRDEHGAVETSAEVKPTIKQAVVVIHGMGEQAPMQTLRSFVHAVWETDLSLTEASDPQKVRTTRDGEVVNKTWIVPDTRTGSLELSRITTAEADSGVRTDFYEFYWADIMQGTTVQHVTAWVSGLLLRWPHQVPRNVLVVWIALWFLTIAAIWFALSGLLGLAGLAAVNPVANWLDALDHQQAEAIGAWLCIVAALLGAGVLLYLVPDKPKRHASSVLFAIFAPLLAGWALYWAVPWEHVLTWPALSLAVSAAIAAFIRSALVPYFGDVARYVRAAPETVAKRAEVRQRGLELLARLHNPASPHPPEIRPAERLVDSAKPVPPQEVNDAIERGAPVPVVPPVPDQVDRSVDYVRIIVVAHSLGSIIAYDILHHFWNIAGPTRASPPDFEALEALNALDDYVRTHSGKGAPAIELGELRRLQRRASAAIGGTGKWRITDLVTVGSPLAHADFLLARDDERFRALVDDRQIPVAPPVLDDETNSFLIQNKLRVGEEPEIALHHASVFSAVRWVNIFDPHAFLLGDVVSGPLQRHFGCGLADWAVKIKRRWPPVLQRLVTHTLYWSMDVRSSAANADAKTALKGLEGGPDHIVLLRKAIGLADVAPEVARKKEADATLVV